AVGQNRDYVTQATNSTISESGIMMSWIYGLHLLNNGYTNTKYSVNKVIDELLDKRTKDGGWALAPKGPNADVDITAMALQALAPYYKSNNKVKTAVDVAVDRLSVLQMSTGGFKGYGVENAESTAQVITALSSLGINALTDQRFIKNNNTLIDVLLSYQLADTDRSFCHIQGGGSDNAATVQAMYSLISIWRMTKGYGPLYIVSSPGMTPPPPGENTTSPTKPATKPTVSTNPTTTAKPTDNLPAQTSSGSNPANTSGVSNPSRPTVTNEAGEIVEGMGQAAPDETLQGETLQGETSPQTEKQENTESAGTRSGAYKKWVCLAIVLLALGGGLVLMLTGKGNKKNLFVLLLTAAVLIGLVLITGPKATTTKPAIITTQATGSVSIDIQCNEAVEHIRTNDVKGYENIVPQDGVILSLDDVRVQDDETVLDVIKKVTKDKKIILIATDGYVSNIGGLVERAKDFGPESGWLYSVNGEFPSLGVSQYKLKNGDQIEFKFVTKRTEF
ncbi:MAG: DUF4430 domain-containing protein, partial [Clostridiales bacterium]|nr:DUF4430 domain-containing protein [Clostridiales bacterium]